MELLDRYIFKALLNLITVEELESYLYQDHIIDKIVSDELIFDLVTINYRKEDWKHDLKKVAYNYYDETKILVEKLNFNCLALIETRNEKEIYDIVFYFSNLCVDYDYEYNSLFYFYQFNVRWRMVLDKVADESLNEIIQDIKGFARKFNDCYNLTKNVDELLNISTEYLINYFQEVNKEDVLNHIASKKINFESTNRFKSVLKIKYDEKEIDNIELDIVQVIKSKLKNRITIFIVVGIPLFVGGYLGVSKGNKGFVYVIFLLGLGMLLTVLVDIIQLIWYSNK